MSTLAVPYRFLPSVVRDQVQPGRPGAYILGNDEAGFTGKYVGRSDTSLLNRLVGHNHLLEFEYFIYCYAADKREAFRQECEFYHVLQNQGDPLTNRIHPAAPKGSGLRCPYCEFGEQVSSLFGA